MSVSLQYNLQHTMSKKIFNINHKYGDCSIFELRRLVGKIEVSISINDFGKVGEYKVVIDDATPKYDFRIKSDLDLIAAYAKDKAKEIYFPKHYIR